MVLDVYMARPALVYGYIISLRMGREPWVVLSSPSVVHDALVVRGGVSGRPIVRAHAELLADPSLPTAARPSHPYMRVVVNEVLRTKPPLLLPCHAVVNSRVREYAVLERTIVLTNSWAPTHGEGWWKGPGRFRPERWLEEERVVEGWTCVHLSRTRLGGGCVPGVSWRRQR